MLRPIFAILLFTVLGCPTIGPVTAGPEDNQWRYEHKP